MPDWNAATEITAITPVWGEAALQFGQEILTANVLSRCLVVLPDDTRVRALQARLLERNGNHTDAEALIQALLDEWRSQAQSQDGIQNMNRLWLAEAALELRHYPEAMQNSASPTQMDDYNDRYDFLQLLCRNINNWLKCNWRYRQPGCTRKRLAV